MPRRPSSRASRGRAVTGSGSASTPPAYAAMLRICSTRSLLRQLDLFEIELDRGRAAEDRDRDLDPVLVEVELLDDAVEAGERTVEDFDGIADLVIDADLLARLGGGL